MSYYKDKVRFVNFIVDTVNNRKIVPIEYFYTQSLLRFGFGKKTVDSAIKTLDGSVVFLEDEVLYHKKAE